MSTFMPKAKDISRKWYVIDAAGTPLGKVAAQAAILLRGKHKPTFTPHVDCGDHVVIVNCAKAVLTGNKLTQKYHYHHTGYVGHMKAQRYDSLMKERPDYAVRLAVAGMMPKNTLGRTELARLRLSVDDTHEHAAQKPELWAV
ncbi:MAG: 50S ribosomal protein L13 [Oscillospiraceae bacterium]|jgi:large subunit ribosomal protein L13|nr:50S ribosomal protein L13 [Oscillospiraceae bacterium]